MFNSEFINKIENFLKKFYKKYNFYCNNIIKLKK